jgi:arylsulfatase A-like enzyme
VDLYDGEIRYVDHLVGEIANTLDELDLVGRTVMAITSDHGEQLGQHGLYDHEMVHEAVIQVPIILWGPGIIPAGKTYAGYVQQADLAPTILSLLGAERAELPSFDGSDLLAFAKGELSPRERIFSEGHHYRALIEGKWKYSRSYFQGLDELYELESDPMEVINLVGQERERADEMKERLDRWVNENLKGELDPMWTQVSRWAAIWSATLPKEFYDLRVKPYILRGQR